VAESGESKNAEGSSSISKEAAPAPSSPMDAPKSPSAETQEIGSIKTLLENVRQSNLKKDIDLFVACYTSDFVNLEGRKRATLAYWKNFSYLDLSYDLKDLSISVETAKARVEWLIKTSSSAGGQPQQNKSVLDVAFKKEDGRWKIKEVKPAK
jgi:ketosteroid isomerase-like protein